MKQRPHPWTLASIWCQVSINNLEQHIPGLYSKEACIWEGGGGGRRWLLCEELRHHKWDDMWTIPLNFHNQSIFVPGEGQSCICIQLKKASEIRNKISTKIIKMLERTSKKYTNKAWTGNIHEDYSTTENMEKKKEKRWQPLSHTQLIQW